MALDTSRTSRRHIRLGHRLGGRQLLGSMASVFNAGINLFYLVVSFFI